VEVLLGAQIYYGIDLLIFAFSFYRISLFMTDTHQESSNGKLAFIFPGQGSQSTGMLAELASEFEMVGATYSEASDAVGFDLWQLTQTGSEGELNRTENTQPALLTAGVAVWRIWQTNHGQQPEVMAGHSLGEYTALVCSGSISLVDAVKLVKDRGNYMQQAVAEGSGAMTAILGLDESIISELCNDAAQGEVVTVANINSPKQIVIAGHVEAVRRASVMAKNSGAKRTVELSVSVPSHCVLMESAAEKLSERLNQIDINDADVPIVQNIDALPRTNASEIRSALISQLCQPVQWTKTITKFKDMEISSVIESGPGKVLSGLVKQNSKEMNSVSISDPTSLKSILEPVKNEN